MAGRRRPAVGAVLAAAAVLVASAGAPSTGAAETIANIAGLGFEPVPIRGQVDTGDFPVPDGAQFEFPVREVKLRLEYQGLEGGANVRNEAEFDDGCRGEGKSRYEFVDGIWDFSTATGWAVVQHFSSFTPIGMAPPGCEPLPNGLQETGMARLAFDPRTGKGSAFMVFVREGLPVFISLVRMVLDPAGYRAAASAPGPRVIQRASDSDRPHDCDTLVPIVKAGPDMVADLREARVLGGQPDGDELGLELQLGDDLADAPGSFGALVRETAPDGSTTRAFRVRVEGDQTVTEELDPATAEPTSGDPGVDARIDADVLRLDLGAREPPTTFRIDTAAELADGSRVCDLAEVPTAPPAPSVAAGAQPGSSEAQDIDLASDALLLTTAARRIDELEKVLDEDDGNEISSIKQAIGVVAGGAAGMLPDLADALDDALDQLDEADDQLEDEDVSQARRKLRRASAAVRDVIKTIESRRQQLPQDAVELDEVIE